MAVKECCCVKPSPDKKSIFGLKMGCQILSLLLLFSCLLVTPSSADTELSCTNVKNIFERKGILSSVDIQEQPNADADGLCLSRGCCGAAARTRLTQQARTQLESALRSELAKLSETLANRGRKFDEFFRKLLQLSREEFHAMFKRTYGMIYEQHSYVFEQLFEQLERYYARGDTDFDLMMDGFFGILYQKMFTVLNSQYSFDEKYLKCVNEHMRDIQPFEDVPNKLSVQLRRAFVATRTFHKALRAGSEVVRNMMQVGVTQECVTSWARLRYCGTCSGLNPPACSRYCHNVIRGCLPSHADLNDNWDAYVDAVEKVADRLLGPFNIAMVVEPIDIKISEAIMSFQEHNQEISQKIFAGCGKPILGGGASTGPFFAPDGSRRPARSIRDIDMKPNDVNDFEIETSDLKLPSFSSFDPILKEYKKDIKEMGERAKIRDKFIQYVRDEVTKEDYERYKEDMEHERRKREADPEAAPKGPEFDFKQYEFENKRGGAKKKKPAVKPDDGHGAEWGGPALERLVRETRARMRSSKRYWSHLPALLCSSTSVTSSPCFNGTHVASYIPGPAGEGSAALASNPEVRGLAAATGTAVARTQQDVLKTLTARLKDAYNGVEVQWKDADDLQVSSSSLDFATSEGSGSGSGDDSDDDLPDDDEDRQDYPEGSGERPPAVEEPIVPQRPPTDVRPPPVVPSEEEPFVPSIINTPTSNNVNIRGRVADVPVDSDPVPNSDPVDIDTPSNPVNNNNPPPSVRDQPVGGSGAHGSHQRPSLQKALFTYAFPVVCAWFGTIVTDLF